MTNKLTKNVIFSVINLLITAISIAVQYKIVIQELGMELLGLWSLIMSISTIIQVGNGSASGTMIKFTTESISKNEEDHIQYYLNSTLLLTIFFWTILSTLIYSVYLYVPNLIIGNSKLENLGAQLLPLTLLNLLLNIVSQIFFSVQEGYKLSYKKSISNIIIVVLMLPISIYAIYSHGLLGLITSQIIQNLFLVIIAIIKTTKTINYSIRFKLNWSYLKNVISYNSKMQIAMLFRLTYEPIFKAILANNVNLESVGLFEIANKIATYARTIYNVALYNIIPYITEYDTNNDIYKKALAFSKISTITNFCMLSILTLLLSSSFIIKIYFHIENEDTFIFYMLIISIGTIINGYSVAPYYFDFASGYLNSILKMYILTTVYLGISSVILLSFTPKISMVWAWFISMSIGSLHLVYDYLTRNDVAITTYVSKTNALSISLIIGTYIITNNDIIIATNEIIKSAIVFLIGFLIVYVNFKKEIYCYLLSYKK